MSVPHYEKVDKKRIEAKFTDDKRHRSSLVIPFMERDNCKELCVIGQNPSDANEEHADKTIYYLEKYVFQKLPEYSSIIMLNLYSRVDKSKEKTADLERPETTSDYLEIIRQSSDFLLVYGASERDGKYNFREKALELKELLVGKNIYKIDIESNIDYPPHPGNPKILYRNYSYDITVYSL